MAQHLGIPDHIDVIGDAGGFSQVMRDHHAGDPQRIIEQTDQPHQNAHGNRILAHERLVIQQDLRVHRDGAGQRNTTLHAPRQLVRHQFQRPTQTDGLQFHQDNVTNHFFGELGVHTQRECHVLEHVEIGEQRTALKQHAHLLAHVEQLITRQLRQADTRDANIASRGPQLGSDQAQQGRLAAAGGAHDAGDLAARDADVDLVENRPRATLKADALQLDRVLVLGAHLNSLKIRPSLQTLPPEARTRASQRGQNGREL